MRLFCIETLISSYFCEKDAHHRRTKLQKIKGLWNFFPLFCEEKLEKSPLIFGSASVAVTNIISCENELFCTDITTFRQRATYEAPKAVEAIFSASVIFTKR